MWAVEQKHNYQLEWPYLVNFVEWGLKAGRILRIRLFEIEFDCNFSSISLHLRSTESTFHTAKKFRIRLSEIE